ncbi:MAG: DNA topoisomerase IV subunit B, partial [Candidatus Vogelbacteria bacterium]|nr:DNA topoisomerase IV subunit B [Candidatus Vogelbacteria bacterium]
RYYRQLIDAGKIYIAQPPLYKVKKGKEFAYAYSDEEKNKIIKEMGGTVEQIEEVDTGEQVEAETEPADAEATAGEGSSKNRPGKISIQRYKGLGEMNPEELWETTMNPATRIMKQVTIDDVTDADKTFDILMGSEVEPRKLFIQTHAHLANVDV